ncbi:MAG: hypothetical protein ABI353_03120 [Isosphaeraceae bacterium]
MAYRRWYLLGLSSMFLVLEISLPALGQFGAPAPSAAPQQDATEVMRLTHELAEQVQNLVEDVALDLRQTANGRRMLQDAEELAKAVEDFHETLHGQPDLVQFRQSFASLDSTWHRLKDGFTQFNATPAISRGVARVDAVDVRLHQALGLAMPTGDLGRLAQQMADAVLDLRQRMEAERVVQIPGGRHMIQDSQELAQALLDFTTYLGQRPSLDNVRRAYSGVETSWHHMRSELARLEGVSPAIGQAMTGIDRSDGQFHQALGLPTSPLEFYGEAAPNGVNETRRLAAALDSRAQTLAASIQGQMAEFNNGDDLYRDTARLARACDRFQATIQDGQPPDAYQTAFQPIAQLSDRLEANFRAAQLPPPVQQSWQAFRASEYLLRQNLNLPAPPPIIQFPLQPAQGPPPILDLATRLVAESDAFLRVFASQSSKVPERQQFLTDATRLRDAAVAYQQEVARGLAPNQLAYAFRNVDAAWQRLARRTNRIAKGQTGQNIQQVEKIGALCQQMHQMLGMPGYAPTLGPFRSLPPISPQFPR